MDNKSLKTDSKEEYEYLDIPLIILLIAGIIGFIISDLIGAIKGVVLFCLSYCIIKIIEFKNTELVELEKLVTESRESRMPMSDDDRIGEVELEELIRKSNLANKGDRKTEWIK
jgi:hypothetical protein